MLHYNTTIAYKCVEFLAEKRGDKGESLLSLNLLQMCFWAEMDRISGSSWSSEDVHSERNKLLSILNNKQQRKFKCTIPYYSKNVTVVSGSCHHHNDRASVGGTIWVKLLIIKPKRRIRMKSHVAQKTNNCFDLISTRRHTSWREWLHTLFPLSTPSRYHVASLNTCPHNARRQLGVAARWASVERGEGWREMRECWLSAETRSSKEEGASWRGECLQAPGVYKYMSVRVFFCVPAQ